MTFDFFGHQLVAHLVSKLPDEQTSIYPRHFGVCFSQLSEFDDLRRKVDASGIAYFRKPNRRFTGKPTEHHTFFLRDPAYNVVEFKYYLDSRAVLGMHEFNHVGDAEEALNSLR